MSRKILVVDDDEMNLRRAEFILSKDGYQIHKVQSGMECLLFLRDEKVDLVLLDVEMPIMSGIQTLEIMKANEELSDIPVIFLTAAADAETVIEAGKLGATDYVTKPFMPQNLLERVDKVIYNRKF